MRVDPAGALVHRGANPRVEHPPMTKPVKPIPDGYHTATPYLVQKDCGKAIAWYAKAFGAVERCRIPGPGGKIMHAEITIGNSILMMCDEFPGMCQAPAAGSMSPVSIHLYFEDAKAAWKRAIDAGATSKMELQPAFWGDLFGALADPFGHAWSIAQHIEDVPPEEIPARAAKAMENCP